MTATVQHRHLHLPHWMAPPTIAAHVAKPTGWLWVVGASSLVGVVLSQSPSIATAHQAIVLLTLAIVGLSARGPAPILFVTCYAGSCDVLWRMTGARGPFEAGKYALILGFGCVAVRLVRRPRNAGLVVTFLALLVPGVLIAMQRLGISNAREYAAANLAGLVALAVGVLACSNVRATLAEVRGLFMASLSSAVSVAAIATIATLTAEDLEFGDSSNFATSAGFGPNQVSALICFGGLLCVLIVIQPRVTWRERVLALATATWLVGQAVLTFSRGGLFSFVIAAAAVGITALTLSGQRSRTIVAAAAVMALAMMVLSWAGAFTEGASEDRVSDTDSSNRMEIAEADLELFYENPATGVGVGVAKFDRDFSIETAPHIEATRMLAEHGVAGLAAIAIVLFLAVRIIRQAHGWYRLAAVGLIVMSVAQTMHSATRIGCIALGFALASLREEPG